MRVKRKKEEKCTNIINMLIYVNFKLKTSESSDTIVITAVVLYFSFSVLVSQLFVVVLHSNIQIAYSFMSIISNNNRQNHILV
jgi:hypothetical protein